MEILCNDIKELCRPSLPANSKPLVAFIPREGFPFELPVDNLQDEFGTALHFPCGTHGPNTSGASEISLTGGEPSLRGPSYPRVCGNDDWPKDTQAEAGHEKAIPHLYTPFPDPLPSDIHKDLLHLLLYAAYIGNTGLQGR
jgi:hypothetical protein